MNALDYSHSPFGGIGSTLFVGVASQPTLMVLPKPKGPPLKQVIDEVFAAKVAANRRPAYTRHLRIYLNRFARGREDTPINEFDMASIEQWLAGQKDTPTARKGHWGRLSCMFSYAKRKKYITENPCSGMDRPRIDPKPPVIFTVDEADKLLRWLATEGRRRWRLAQVVLGLFTGIRPVELTRIYWRDIELERALVRVDASASKVRQRRIVPLPQNAVEWLKLCPRTDKPIGAIRWKWIATLERGTGLKWSNDVLRHSAASYLLAKHDDCGKVSRWLGNSPVILLNHYTELVGKAEAGRYFNIRPDMTPKENLFTRAERGQTSEIARSTLDKIKFLLKHADADLLRRVRSGWTCMSDAWDECSVVGAWQP